MGVGVGPMFSSKAFAREGMVSSISHDSCVARSTFSLHHGAVRKVIEIESGVIISSDSSVIS